MKTIYEIEEEFECIKKYLAEDPNADAVEVKEFIYKYQCAVDWRIAQLNELPTANSEVYSDFIMYHTDLIIRMLKGRDRFFRLRNTNEIENSLVSFETKRAKALSIIEALNIKEMDCLSIYNAIFHTGNTDTIFTFDTEHMQALLKRFKPNTIGELALLSSLSQSYKEDLFDAIVARRNSDKPVQLVHPTVDKILRTTYGFPVYSEQIEEILVEMGGFTNDEAALCRKTLGAKKADIIPLFKERFCSNVELKGFSEMKALEIWELICLYIPFQSSKQHAAECATIAFELAAIQHCRPDEYFKMVQ